MLLKRGLDQHIPISIGRRQGVTEWREWDTDPPVSQKQALDVTDRQTCLDLSGMDIPND